VPAGVPFLSDPAGGLTLISLPAFDAPPGAGAGPVEDVRVTGNYFGDNRALVPSGPPAAPLVSVQMDIVVSDPLVPPLLPPGGGLVFRGNHCDATSPAGICGAPPDAVG
jgi:hypothetical protein